jgi:hypothetical protein
VKISVETNKRFSRAELAVLAAWLALLVLWMARGTFALPYLSDDFVHGELIAHIRAGLRPASDLIAVPYHGQTLVLLRLAFWFGTLAGGMSLAWVRIAICLVHAAGATGSAVLCARWSGSKFAGFLAGTLYAGALGFVNEQIWWPSSAIFCLGASFFILALVALEEDSLVWAVLWLVAAALGLNGVLVPALVLPVYAWAIGRKRAAGILLGAIATLLALAFWQQARTHDRESLDFSLRAVELGGWLVLTAPFRFFAGFTTFAIPGFRTILDWSAVAWLPLLVSGWFLRARYGRVLLLVWAPAVLLSITVGVARADFDVMRYGPGVLYVADRYYYFFLLPLATQCVLVLHSVRWPRWMAAVILAGALAGSYAHFHDNVVLGHFEAGRKALNQARAVFQAVRSAPVRPLVLGDVPVPVDGALFNKATLAFLIYGESPGGIPGVRVVRGPLDARQEAMEDALLRPWLRPTPARIDFQEASYEEDLDSGFSWWEPPFRWMGRQASLRLMAAPGDLVVRAYAPVEQLHRVIHIAVAVNGRAIGQLAVGLPGTREYILKAPPLTPGTTVNITLTSDTVWHARDILPDSLDERDLSIAISSIGFSVRP